MSLKIALIGYGKMGKEIEQIALDRNHTISHKFTSSNPPSVEELKNCDVAIEFSKPDLALKHIDLCLAAHIPVVVGTTGWNEHLEAVTQKVKESKGALLHASNFSVGVNLFFALNKRLAEMMNPFPEYKVSVEETHHTQKLDAPSGTGITIAEGIVEKLGRVDSWIHGRQAKSNELPVIDHRIPDVPGTHEVYYQSEIDTIEIKHVAHNRKGFALGSVLAAEFLHQKEGVFTMQDLLKF